MFGVMSRKPRVKAEADVWSKRVNDQAKADECAIRISPIIRDRDREMFAKHAGVSAGFVLMHCNIGI